MANSGPNTNKCVVFLLRDFPRGASSADFMANLLVACWHRSQFFITYSKQAHLDSKYTIFGRVIDGQDSTLDAMERVPVDAKNRPKEEIKTLEVIMHANPLAEKDA